MSRIAIPARESAPQAAQPLLDAVEKRLGAVPNLFRLIANSPEALEGFSAFSGALARTLDVRTRARIALAVAQVNGCDYCLSAHTYMGLNLAKLTPEEIALNRKATSGDPKSGAAVRFAARVAEKRGHVSDEDLADVRLGGFGDKQIIEIVAMVAEHSFTNFLNMTARTEIDFPIVLAAEAA